MELLVVYDIDTTTVAGERRLRAVAKICEAYGHRVQKSVFECVLDAMRLRQLIDDLEKTISPTVDQVGIYRLREPRLRSSSASGEHRTSTTTNPLCCDRAHPP